MGMFKDPPKYDTDEATAILSDLVPERAQRARERASVALVRAFLATAAGVGLQVDEGHDTIDLPGRPGATVRVTADPGSGAVLEIVEASGQRLPCRAPGLSFVPLSGRFVGTAERSAVAVLADAVVAALKA